MQEHITRLDLCTFLEFAIFRLFTCRVHAYSVCIYVRIRLSYSVHCVSFILLRSVSLVQQPRQSPICQQIQLYRRKSGNLYLGIRVCIVVAENEQTSASRYTTSPSQNSRLQLPRLYSSPPSNDAVEIAEKLESWGPIYKISYDSLTIILR